MSKENKAARWNWKQMLSSITAGEGPNQMANTLKTKVNEHIFFSIPEKPIIHATDENVEDGGEELEDRFDMFMSDLSAGFEIMMKDTGLEKVQKKLIPPIIHATDESVERGDEEQEDRFEMFRSDLSAAFEIMMKETGLDKFQKKLIPPKSEEEEDRLRMFASDLSAAFQLVLKDSGLDAVPSLVKKSPAEVRFEEVQTKTEEELYALEDAIQRRSPVTPQSDGGIPSLESSDTSSSFRSILGEDHCLSPKPARKVRYSTVRTDEEADTLEYAKSSMTPESSEGRHSIPSRDVSSSFRSISDGDHCFSPNAEKWQDSNGSRGSINNQFYFDLSHLDDDFAID